MSVRCRHKNTDKTDKSGEQEQDSGVLGVLPRGASHTKHISCLLHIHARSQVQSETTPQLVLHGFYIIDGRINDFNSVYMLEVDHAPSHLNRQQNVENVKSSF